MIDAAKALREILTRGACLMCGAEPGCNIDCELCRALAEPPITDPTGTPPERARDSRVYRQLYEAWNVLSFDWESMPPRMRRQAVQVCREALDEMLNGFTGKPFRQWCDEQWSDEPKAATDPTGTPPEQEYWREVADRILEADGAVAHDWLCGVAKQLRLSAPAVPGGWQAIESCPLVKTVLLWGPGWRSPFVGMRNGGKLPVACWIDGDRGGCQMYSATHWHPLPPLPSPPDGVTPR